MIPALWISKTGLDAQQTNISVTSNNLANASTVGYKKSRAIFEDLLYQKVNQPGGRSTADAYLPEGLMLGAGSRVVATQKSFTQGDVENTDNSFDLMIQGRGFFEIEMPDGTTAYTRNGQFTKNEEGTIVTAQGYPLLPQMQVPENAVGITVSQDGQVSIQLPDDPQGQDLGQITVTDFINPSGLEPIGDNLYIETAASGAPQQGIGGEDGMGTIRQGMLESSNVQVTEELVNLITAQRVYEMNSKVLTTVDEMMGSLISST
ncbi:MAG: flagellar basal-body rod protein FlgG [Proteobacteria bacterium]|uniref:Flagellar basal-body rod protein FlgG n=1 Tax=Candidatus Avisuccinivibrio stercorigallinarum TaxID=2840704 RepID=A0A9D9DBL5_9GAMM|nr:flagellar basal-body rod protein FlgG [Candidatus Avisuccinivibrio stercorigallinarum]